jgi:hypothetical protein
MALRLRLWPDPPALPPLLPLPVLPLLLAPAGPAAVESIAPPLSEWRNRVRAPTGLWLSAVDALAAPDEPLDTLRVWLPSELSSSPPGAVEETAGCSCGLEDSPSLALPEEDEEVPVAVGGEARPGALAEGTGPWGDVSSRPPRRLSPLSAPSLSRSAWGSDGGEKGSMFLPLRICPCSAAPARGPRACPVRGPSSAKPQPPRRAALPAFLSRGSRAALPPGRAVPPTMLVPASASRTRDRHMKLRDKMMRREGAEPRPHRLRRAGREEAGGRRVGAAGASERATWS